MPELYWKEVNKPYSYKNEATGEIVEGINKREIVSDNPNVQKIWVTGYAKPSLPPRYATTLHILGIGMERFDQDITDEQYESLDIPEAIEFINHL